MEPRPRGHVRELSEQVRGWLEERLPGGWFIEPAEVWVDRDEVLVLGRLPDVEGEPSEARRSRCRERIREFRELSRQARMTLSDEGRAVFERPFSWGAACGDERALFTTLSVPVMTRLRLPERVVLDTLVAAGVARSRSDALAWCVRLVRAHEGEWLEELREALGRVERLRVEGPVVR